MEDKKRRQSKRSELPGGGAKTPSVCSSRSCTPSAAENAFPVAAARQSGRQRPPSSTSANSSSLDETDIRRAHDRRLVSAPRRARSAERFDGIRVAPANNASGTGFERDELLARGLQQAGQGFGRPPNGFFIPRPSDSLASLPKAMPSPPPPYTPTPTIHSVHATEQKGAPPSYTQALQQALLAKEHAKKLNERYAMQHRHGTQSFEAAAYAGRGVPAATLRSATSVPTFKNYGGASLGAGGAACGCSKCQVGERGIGGGELGCDDAVYMESQAFLMHEIMTDGMAFCSIV